MDTLKLMALDAQDLEIVSAHVQDAVFKVAGISYSARTGTFALVVNRFVWEKAVGAKAGGKTNERRPRGDRLPPGQVRALHRFSREDEDAVLSLLALRFLPEGDGPGGVLELVLAGDATIALTVECIEVQLADTGGAWEPLSGRVIPRTDKAPASACLLPVISSDTKDPTVAIRLDHRASDFEAAFAAFLTNKREVSQDVDTAVREIIENVRKRGDAALAEYTLNWDRLDFSVTSMAVGADEVDAAINAVPAEVLGALKVAAVRIESHHARQLPKDDIYTDAMGVGLGSRWTPIDAVGLYVRAARQAIRVPC